MSAIEKIKTELAKISPWPWVSVENNEKCPDADFIAAAPARIAKLLAVAEAAPKYLSLTISSADAIAYRLEQGDDNGDIGREALARWLRALAGSLNQLEQALQALEADDDR